MLLKIDWLSFSVKIPEGRGRKVLSVARLAEKAIRALHPDLIERLGMSGDWKPSTGRKPYSEAFTWHDNGLTLFVHPNLPHALVEISGKGCDVVLQGDWMTDILQPIMNRLTRIDLACDMLTSTKPLDFATNRVAGRFRAHSEASSESGDTCYIGSKTSNRYAKVYRYNPPHERAHLLRCEYTLKAEDAKGVAHSLIQDGILPVISALGEKFGWQHPDWSPEPATPAELQAYRADRREGKTLFWLNDTIAPLLLRLHREQTLELGQWFRDNIEAKMTAEEYERFMGGRT